MDRRFAGHDSAGTTGLPGADNTAVAEPSPPDRGLMELYAAYADLVWRSLMRQGVPTTVIDDAVQDVFLVAHRRLACYDERGQRTAWLIAICRRVAADYRRAELRRANRESRSTCVGQEPVDPEQELELQDTAAFVQRFLDTLAPERRDVFVLCDIEGLSAPEAAEALGIKLNTVYSRRGRARKLFEQALVRWKRKQRTP